MWLDKFGSACIGARNLASLFYLQGRHWWCSQVDLASCLINFKSIGFMPLDSSSESFRLREEACRTLLLLSFHFFSNTGFVSLETTLHCPRMAKRKFYLFATQDDLDRAFPSLKGLWFCEFFTFCARHGAAGKEVNTNPHSILHCFYTCNIVC